MTITHNTGKAELCFVKVPTDSNEAEIVTNQAVIPYGKSLVVPDGYYKCFPNHMFIDLPSGNWQIVGNPFELTEQVCRCFVQEVDHPYDYQYIDYENPGRLYLTAQRSMRSLLDHLKIYQANPYSSERPSDCYYPIDKNGKREKIHDGFQLKFDKYQERTGSFILLKNIAP